MMRFLNWLFTDPSDTARRAIYTAGQGVLSLGALDRMSDYDLGYLDLVGAIIIGALLSVMLSGIRGART